MSRSNNKSPAFQFYPLDFIGDENVQLMENEAVGCYIKLMCHEWIEKSIPDDVTACAKLVGELTQQKKATAKFVRAWPTIRLCFAHGRKAGRLIHPRLERERKAQRKRKERLSSAGKLGAEATHRNRQELIDLTGDGDGDAKNRTVAIGGTSSSSSPSSSKTTYTDEFLEFWKHYPDRMGGNPKRSAFKNWQKRVKDGVKPADLIRAARGYCSELSDMKKIGTEFVMQAQTFLGPNERYVEYITKKEEKKWELKKRYDPEPDLPEISAAEREAQKKEIRKAKDILKNRRAGKDE